MKLKTTIKTIYGEINIFNNEDDLVGSIYSYQDCGYSVRNADIDEQEKISSEIARLFDRQVREICVNTRGEINIYLK